MDTDQETIVVEKKKRKNSTAYIDNQKFYDEIVAYKKTVAAAKAEGKPKPQLTRYLAECIMKIAENLARSPKYSKYTWKDMMISDAIINCLTYFDNFDVDRPKRNPFAYYTRISIYAFHRRIKIEKAQIYKKYKLAQHLGIEHDLDMEQGEGEADRGLYDNIEEFIVKYEEKEKSSKKKSKAHKSRGLDKFIGADEDESDSLEGFSDLSDGSGE